MRNDPYAKSNWGLEKFFVGIEAAVFAGVVERDVAVSSLFELIDFAGVEGLGVDVNADGALVVFGEIQDLMDGFERIDVDGISGIHFVDVCRDETTGAGVIGDGVTIFDDEVKITFPLAMYVVTSA